MRRALPLGLHVPGDSIWHRIPTGRKLLGVVVVGVLVVALPGPWPPVVALGLATGVAVHAGVPWRSLALGVRPLLVVLAVLAAFQTWQRGWPVAVEIVATTLTLVVLATTFTATTATDDLLDAIVRIAGVLRPLRVDPERVALAFSLAISSIPTVMTLFDETREAAKARGLERSPRATLAPFAVRTVAHAHDVGDALAARGLGD
ncbi:energy-coupling factor transporter transmembrane protein EcfT [Aeromicrobium sp. 50.2.37]|uniref:energy-coupling factor transporter transmembrane component T family protein n=1 Tax=Aeromicrobium sp. 50.2.37 TaxID=2969305 RepID=UPI00214FA257|nr:energy-coupling factor transporter transmembrane protein EcfT [Aeromicrobium sp. 50.2.37]MCR4514759.1 energy-coupling factor transporter transmembrane protein EcfT [Aeromicrobium sp. 50.2.37]